MKKMKIGILLAIAVLALVSVASALPTQAVGSISQTAPGGPYYWNVNIASTTPSGDSDLATGNHGAYCADAGTGISPVYNPFTFNVYSSLSPPASSIPTANWPKINWALNNKGSNWKAVQMLVWHYDGQSGAEYPWHSSLGTQTQADRNAYDALKAGSEVQGSFTPN
jgi:hypothetical protein